MKINNGSSVAPGLENVLPQMAVNNDMLYQVEKINGEILEQLRGQY